MPVGDVLAALGTSEAGLSVQEWRARLALFGPNAVRSHGAHALPVLGRQLRSPLLMLLAACSLAFFDRHLKDRQAAFDGLAERCPEALVDTS